MHFDEETVVRAIDTLRQKDMLHVVNQADSRVTKYRHVVYETLNLDRRQIAVMCILLLRGPQTVGEVRTRTNRLYDFDSIQAVETALNSLMAREPPLIMCLPRQTGQKEVRYAHLLAGEVSASLTAASRCSSRYSQRSSPLEQVSEDLRNEIEDSKGNSDSSRSSSSSQLFRRAEESLFRPPPCGFARSHAGELQDDLFIFGAIVVVYAGRMFHIASGFERNGFAGRELFSFACPPRAFEYGCIPVFAMEMGAAHHARRKPDLNDVEAGFLWIAFDDGCLETKPVRLVDPLELFGCDTDDTLRGLLSGHTREA